jgi:hypothetical protein
MIDLKNKIIWWLRFIVKVFLLSIYIPNKAFNKIGLFKHGAMDQDSYVDHIWKIHFIDLQKQFSISRDRFFLEIGPGDSLKSSIKAYKNGFKNISLIDKGNYAIDYIKIKNFFNENCFKNGMDLEKDIKKFNYLTNGTKSFSKIPNASVSFIFSNSVLQHFDKNEVDFVIENLYRISSLDCIHSHVIDLKDMINRSHLHHKCPDSIWESKFFKKFLVYTNRLNAADWLGLFEKYGFKIISAKMYDDNDNLIDADISFDKLLHKIANIHLIAKKL